MQKFIAEESFWKLFPDAAIGVVVARDMKPAADISDEDADAVRGMLASAIAAADVYLTSDQISQNQVVAVWREAYRLFKTRKGARCSIENLLKRVLKGSPVGSITPSVDIYNAVSLKYALPVGGEDIDSFTGNVRLGVTKGGDAFRPLGEGEDDPTLPGELCYRDDIGAVCRCWNWRDGERTALSDDSRDGFLVVECVDPQRIGDLRLAIDELAAAVEQYLGAHIETTCIVTRDSPSITIVE